MMQCLSQGWVVYTKSNFNGRCRGYGNGGGGGYYGNNYGGNNGNYYGDNGNYYGNNGNYYGNSGNYYGDNRYNDGRGRPLHLQSGSIIGRRRVSGDPTSSDVTPSGPLGCYTIVAGYRYVSSLFLLSESPHPLSEE